MLSLKHPSSCLIVGPSQSGKTSLVRKMIKSNVYDRNIKNIKWCYNYSSPWFLEEPDIDFVEGLPESYENVDLIVIDDLMHRLNERISELFTVVSHHRNIRVILLFQICFPNAKQCATSV